MVYQTENVSYKTFESSYTFVQRQNKMWIIISWDFNWWYIWYVVLPVGKLIFFHEVYKVSFNFSIASNKMNSQLFFALYCCQEIRELWLTEIKIISNTLTNVNMYLNYFKDKTYRRRTIYTNTHYQKHTYTNVHMQCF